MPLVTLKFACEKAGCNGAIEEDVSVSEPDFMAERMSDGDVFEDFDFCCPVCGEEYTVETISSFAGVTATTGNGYDVDVTVHYEPDEDYYEQFLLDYQPANDTVGAFEEARDELLELLQVHGGNEASVLNRMIFSQMIALMEAYLSDKILRLVSDHDELKKRVVSKAGFVQDLKLSLSDVLLDPGRAENAFKIALQKLLYHDLEKVEKLYKITLQGAFFPDDEAVKTDLEAAILVRHDCVHRNGKKVDGTVHTFDAPRIRSLSGTVSALVAHVEEQAEKAIAALRSLT